MEKELLSNCYLFRDMTPDELKKIEPATVSETFAIADEVFNQGDKANALYIIKKGSVKIQQKGSKGKMIEVAKVGSGSHFGEMAFLDGERRSAGVEVVERSEILKIDYEQLRKILIQNPAMAVKFYKTIAVFLCSRLRATTTDVSFAREKT